jgi:hypothetical protein
MMSSEQLGLHRAEYKRLRDRFLPEHRKTILVLESPPKSGLYFYKPEGLTSEPLFSAMMKDVFGVRPSTKEEGLAALAAGGFLSTATRDALGRSNVSARELEFLRGID